MAGSITVSMKGAQGGVAVSIGGGWYARVVDGAREHIASEMGHYIDQIYGAGDASGEDWADLTEVSAEGFNVFYRAIRQSIEINAKRLFDDEGMPRPTPFGTETDQEIITKLEADPRFDPGSRPSRD